MACRGVLFALTEAEVAALRACGKDAACLTHLLEEIEERTFGSQPQWKQETDKAWDAIHRLLGDGDLSFDTGPEPLRFAVLGGESIRRKGYLLSLKTPDQVRAVAEAMEAVDAGEFFALYQDMDAGAYGYPKSQEDCECSWDWFTEMAAFYQRIAASGRWVLFSVDP